MKSRIAAAVLLLGACGQSVLAGQTEMAERPGPQPDGRVLLSTGWKLTPAGDEVKVETLPMSEAASNDGKYLLVLNGGAHPPSVSVIDIASHRELGRTALPDAWLGLRVAPEGNLVYVGGASSGKVFELTLDPTGALRRTREFAVAAAKNPGSPFIGDVALSPDGRVLYAADLYGDSIAQINLQSGKVVDRWRTGRRPYRIAVSPDGAHLLISSWAEGALYEHESGTGILTRKLRVGAHPTDILWVNKPVSTADNGQSYAGQVFVTVGNTNGVADLGVTQDGQITSLESINVGMRPLNPLGMTPSALAADRQGTRLYVACSGANAIAAIDISQLPARMLGFVPSGWYPTAVAVTADGRLAIANGYGAGDVPKQGEPVDSVAGTVQLAATPDQAALHSLTKSAAGNSPYRDEMIYGPVHDPASEFFARTDAHPSPIQHVIYVIKGNQSYDAVLGNLGKGNGDKSLAVSGPATPNLHKLANEFLVFDNLYAAGQNIAEGQNISVGAIAPSYTVKLSPSAYAGRSHVFDFETNNMANTAPAGYLWSNAAEAGLSFRNYGEWVENVTPGAPVGSPQVKAVGDPSLSATTDRNYRGADRDFKDTDRAREFLKDWSEEDAKGAVPQLSIVRLSNDGSYPSHAADAAHVADNDAAVGLLVAGVSRSKAWKSTMIVVAEAASSGPDHVNGYRMPVLIVSPYTRSSTVDSAFYSQFSVLRTIEMTLGLRPMTQFDAGATPMFASFIQQPNAAPFEASPSGK